MSQVVLAPASKYRVFPLLAQKEIFLSIFSNIYCLPAPCKKNQEFNFFLEASFSPPLIFYWGCSAVLYKMTAKDWAVSESVYAHGLLDSVGTELESPLVLPREWRAAEALANCLMQNWKWDFDQLLWSSMNLFDLFSVEETGHCPMLPLP